MKHKIYGFIVGLFLCPLIVWGGLESATYISDLVATNPTGSDNRSTADDHLRLIKSTLKNTFPNITGAVTATQTELNGNVGTASGSFTGTLSGMSSVTTGTVYYSRHGSVVTMYGGQILGTSNAGTMSLSGIPAGLFPAKFQERTIYAVYDNGNKRFGLVSLQTSSTFDFNPLAVSGSDLAPTTFTSSSSKGLANGWSFTYDLN